MKKINSHDVLRSILVINLLLTCTAQPDTTAQQLPVKEDVITPQEQQASKQDEIKTVEQDNKEDVSHTSINKEKREISDQYSFEENLHQLLVITKKDGEITQREKPNKGKNKDATGMLNNMNIMTARHITPATTVRSIGQNAAQEPKQDDCEDLFKESYLPLYACDEIMTSVWYLDDLYRSCMMGCQMKEPVKVTKLKVQSPKPYRNKLSVYHYSAVEMYDNCHVDILLGEHRVKGAVGYTLTDEDIKKIDNDIKGIIKDNVDLIHGAYPKAECSFWKDNQTKNVVTRVRREQYEMFYAPELGDYYIHIPTEQVNVITWDKEYDGFSGQYRWEILDLPRSPCLLKTGSEIVCLGSYSKGESLHCTSTGLLLDPPYIAAWDDQCNIKTVKDTRGAHFTVVGETTMSYKEALQDKNPNIQSLSTAMTHLEELICTTGCSELTMMTMVNNTNVVVDTPVGIWKRMAGPGNSATQCSSMNAGDIVLLTPACTIEGIVGVKQISSAGMTYHWDMQQIFATTVQHPCMTKTATDIAPLLQQNKNGTMSIDTFVGRVELNLKTGESRFLYYNENLRINRKRWFPNVELGQKETGDQTVELEISMMQQMRNLSAEYSDACAESTGPIVLQNIGGTLWMLEQDIEGVWGKIAKMFWLWKVVIAVILGWLGLYMIITIVGLINSMSRVKKVTHVNMSYRRPRQQDTTRL